MRRYPAVAPAGRYGDAVLLPHGAEWPAVPRASRPRGQHRATKDAATADHIDPTKSLAKAKVFLFSGTKDSIVPQSVMDVLNQYYLAFVPPENVRYVNNVPAEHAMVTDGNGNACGHLGSP